MTPRAHALFERVRNAAAGGRWDDALRMSADLVAAAPDDARAARLRAMVLSQVGHAEALAAWERVLALAPGDAEAHFQLGNAAGDRGDFAAAIAHLQAARATLPAHPVLLNNLGLALEASGRLDEAIASFQAALKAEPRAASNIRPSLARVLLRAARYDDALQEIGALDKNFTPAGVWHDFVRLLLARRRFDDADVVLTKAHAALPDDTLVQSLLVASRQRCGDWNDVAPLRDALIARVASERWSGIASGYDFATVCDDPALQRRVAERYAASEMHGALAAKPRAHASEAGRRLRLGFVSSDYREHPVGRLVVALFERLDRSAFEVVAYSTGESRDAAGARIAAAVDRFAALPRRDPVEAARRVRDDAIDVLLDLNGFSGGEALRIFAQRPAPLQVNFLGYTGTLGSDAYDAIVTDSYCVPPDLAHHYVERPLRVDPCYLPSDPARVADAAPGRAEYDLPDDAVVLHAGGALYKVGPELVDAWLSILRDAPGTLLWLRDAGPSIRARVEAYAAARGVAPSRLRFVREESVTRYLARFALADIMIDTAPFGSHTTVNDALFMGVPVVALAGRSFAGRASASQLHAAGRPDLVARTLAEYVELAQRLASDHAHLREARAALRDVHASPLFSAEAYAARFADAITTAWRAKAR